MTSAKSKILELIQEQPDDSSYEEILRELAFQHMVERGLDDAPHGRSITNEEMAHRIRTWAK